ncbi:MAG: hypothetical protein KDD02_17120 [Phaeodactylibacter sp.]|nr:hypothetical protein [Phaeodactylibacter sp.]
MKSLKLLLPALLSASLMVGQGLEVRYFVQNDSVAYFLDGKLVQKPRVRKGRPVTVRLIDYNNYLYQASIKLEEGKEQLAPALSNGMEGLMPSLDESGGSSFNPLMNLFSTPNPTGFPMEAFSLLNFSFGFANKGDAMVKEFKASAAYVKALEENIQIQGKAIQKTIESQKIKTIAADEVQKLKFNPRIPPHRIKELSTQYLETILGTEKAEEISLSSLVDKAETPEKLAEKVQQYEKYTDTLAQELDRMAAVKSALIELQVDSQFVKSVSSYHDESSQRLAQYRQVAQSAAKELPNAKPLDVSELVALRYELEELEANNFTHTYRTTAQGSLMHFDLTLDPIDSAKILGVSQRELPSIDVPVAGNIKIGASFGVSFGSFFDQQQSYFLRDSIIVAEDKDRFLPIITSFIHFYPQSAGNLSVGGAFGLGISLGDGGGLQSASFFVGPSLIFGQNESLTLSGGLMGGKVERLGKGYKLGDSFISEADVVPTRSVYELGYFLGISFNFLSGK